MPETEVLIVGAGPTGLALAVQLIRCGVDFVIIDSKETTTPFSRAIGVQARTLEIYDQIELADKLVSLGHRAEKAKFLKGGEVLGEANLSELGVGLSPYPYVLLVEQGLHEELLYQYVTDSGRDILWQHEMVSFEDDGDGVTAKVKQADGSELTVSAKYLVGCDGAKSSVRRGLGLTFEGDTVERLFYVADIILDWPHGHDALQVNLGEDTLTAFFPLKGENRWRIVGTFPEGHKKDEADIPYEEIEAQIEHDMGVKLDIEKVNWFSVYNVHSRAVNAFSKGRCFVAGDAAHIHTPAGAQGMNTGIQDGYNLAWKLALVLNGRSSAEILNSYNEERLANAIRLLKTTDRMFQLGAGEEWFTSWVRVHIFPYVANLLTRMDFVKRAIFPLVSQIGINYRDASLSVNDVDLKVKAGDRMPYFVLDGRSIYDWLREPKFHFIIFNDGSAPQAKTAGDLGGLADVHHIPLYPHIAEIFDTDQTFCVLLRPDNYICYIASGVNVDGAKEYLRKVLS